MNVIERLRNVLKSTFGAVAIVSRETLVDAVAEIERLGMCNEIINRQNEKITRLRRQLSGVTEAANHWWQDRDSWQSQNDERIEDALYFAELADKRKHELKRLELLVSEQAAAIDRLRGAIPTVVPPARLQLCGLAEAIDQARRAIPVDEGGVDS